GWARIPRWRRRAALTAATVGVGGQLLDLQLAPRDREHDERILCERVPAACAEGCDLPVDASALDAFLIAHRLPEAAPGARRLSGTAPRHVGRTVDVDRRQLAVRDARLVDERNGFGGAPQTNQRLRFEHVHLGATDGDERPVLVRLP